MRVMSCKKDLFVSESMFCSLAKEMLYSIDDDSDQSVEESPRVLAFFDHLIQHEKEDEEEDDDEDNEAWGKNWKQSEIMLRVHQKMQPL